MKKIILASQSPRRRELLMQIGVTFTVEVSDAEEKMSGARPDEIVQNLARRKAEAVAVYHTGEDAVVIGADTIVVYADEILGKPKDAADARRMLRELSGNVHQVYTGVCVIDTGGGEAIGGAENTFAERTDVYVSKLTDADIDAYLATGEPFDKAGSYGIQGVFARHIEKIDGDYTNVVGLPVGRLWRECLNSIQ